MHSYDPSTGEVEAEGSGVHSHPWLHKTGGQPGLCETVIYICIRVSEMAQPGRRTEAKSDNLSLIPNICMVGGENQHRLHKLSFDL